MRRNTSPTWVIEGEVGVIGDMNNSRGGAVDTDGQRHCTHLEETDGWQEEHCKRLGDIRGLQKSSARRRMNFDGVSSR